MSLEIFRLTGRAALVTGGSKGLGKAIARLRRGRAESSSPAATKANSQAAAAEIRRAPGPRRVLRRRHDPPRRRRPPGRSGRRRPGQDRRPRQQRRQQLPQPIDEIRDADWDRFVELNLTSCMALTRALVPGMKTRRWGRIIHISSIMGLASTAGRNVYSATKAALIGMAKASALDLGPWNITVNCLAPGPFATELPLSVLSPAEQAALAARTALNRWGQPAELAGPALLLASEAGSYISGAVLVVDGGALAKVF